MNKKGFTLIELLVSITLVSVILVFMMSSLIRLREVYNDSDNDTDIKVFGSLASNIINDDFIAHDGIREVSCNKENDNRYMCSIKLMDGEERSLALRIKKDKKNYTNRGSNGFSIETYSTIEYRDSKNDKNMFIKTIKSTSNYEGNDSASKLINVYNYHFTSITNTTIDISNKEKVFIITIIASDRNYDVKLYSNYKNYEYKAL